MKQSTLRLPLGFSRLDIGNHLAVLTGHQGTDSLGRGVRAKEFPIVGLDPDHHGPVSVRDGEDMRVTLVQVFRLDVVRLLLPGKVGVEAGKNHQALQMKGWACSLQGVCQSARRSRSPRKTYIPQEEVE